MLKFRIYNYSQVENHFRRNPTFANMNFDNIENELENFLYDKAPYDVIDELCKTGINFLLISNTSDLVSLYTKEGTCTFDVNCFNDPNATDYMVDSINNMQKLLNSDNYSIVICNY